MDISPGDSTPTSEASYSLTGTPKAAGDHQLASATALPSRLSSHPQQSTSSSSLTTASSSTQYHHMQHPSSASTSQQASASSVGGSNCHRKLEGNTSASGLPSALDQHHLNTNTTGQPQKLSGVKSLDQLDAQQKSLDQNHHSSAPTSSSIR